MGCSFESKKVVSIVNVFKRNYTIQKENQTKYGLIKGVNFIKILSKNLKKNNDIGMYSKYNEEKAGKSRGKFLVKVQHKD